MSLFKIDSSQLRNYQYPYDDLDFYSYKIISRSRKFIFYEYPKTASSSLKTMLLPYLYAEYQGRMKFATYKIKQTIKKITGSRYSQWPFGSLGDQGWRQIIPEAHFVDNLYDPRYDSFYKFSIVRNPFDKMVSAYKHGVWGLIDPRNESFEAFLISLLPGGSRELKDLNDKGLNHFMPWTTMFDYNRTDFVIKFENLQHDLNHVSKRIRIRSKLPKENVSRQSMEYHSFYNKNTRKIVEDLYQSDLEVFGYTY